MTAAAALAALCLVRPAAASEAVSAKRRELADVQRQLESKKREIQDFRRQESSLKRDLSSLAAQTAESRQRIQRIEERIRESESKKRALKAKLGALQLAEGRWRGVLGEEVRAYQRSADGQSDAYGRRDLWEEAFRRAAILEKVQYLGSVTGSRRKTEAAEAEARRQAAVWVARSQGVRAEHRSRESLYQQKKEIYQETHVKLGQTEKAVRELQDSAVALTRLLRALEKKSAYKISGERLPLAEPRHSLPWPAEGEVVSSFGKRSVKELNTWVIQQGIRLATSRDAAVRPVKAGTVIFSGPFRSYGLVLIVDHGQAFYTIYGQLGAALKKKGDAVNPADPIATAGPSGDGGTVYFELRQSGDALDPLLWLKEKAP